MGAIERVIERLSRYPQLSYQICDRTIRIDPLTPNGFAVSLSEGEGEWTVHFEGWHEHFTSEEDALQCLAFGLSDRYRLRIHYRGSCAYRWTLQELTRVDHKNPLKTPLFAEGDAKSDARPSGPPPEPAADPLDPLLAELLELWPRLDHRQRQALVRRAARLASKRMPG